LIELMVALVLGLVVVGAVLAVFTANSATVRAVGGVAQVQETTRFVAEMFASDLRQVGYRHCSGLDLKASSPTPIMPHVTASTLPAGLTSSPSAVLTTNSFLQGHECAGTTCVPALPVGLYSIPPAGNLAGNRVPGTDVIIVRYLNGDGARLDTNMSAPDAAVPINPATAGWPGTGVGGVLALLNQWILIGDCRGAEVFAPTGYTTAGYLEHNTARNNSDSLRKSYRADGYTRAYLLPRDLVARAYYVAYRRHEGRLISSLMRMENGSAQAVVDGVERFDLRYRVDNGSDFSMLDGGQVDAANAWGRVEAIDTSMVLSSVNNVLSSPMSITYAGTTVTPVASDLQLRRAMSFTTQIRNPRG
jgi:type IV pilus assembly protein PilW